MSTEWVQLIYKKPEDFPMLSKKMSDAMNEQVKHELYSAYLYLSMAAHFESLSLGGLANWMRAQAGEEQEHALKFFDYILDRGGKVVLQAIDQPTVEFGSPLSVFEEVLVHEQKVTALIHKLYDLAVQENDYASQLFLGWFITEQVEEEKNASTIVDTFKIVGDKGIALHRLDHELGERKAG
jgi:ferritin